MGVRGDRAPGGDFQPHREDPGLFRVAFEHRDFRSCGKGGRAVHPCYVVDLNRGSEEEGEEEVHGGIVRAS
jgi:hypothetical protein